MKKHLWVIGIIGALLFASCDDLRLFDLGEEEFNVPEPTNPTQVEFDNTQNLYDVTVYSNALRQTVIKEVPKGITVTQKWLPAMDGYSFYLTYKLPIVNNYLMPYFPVLNDFVEVIIPRFTTTSVYIQDITKVVDGDQNLSADAYLAIRNDNASGVRLYRVNTEMSSVDGINLINNKSTAVYRITQAQLAGTYTVWSGAVSYPINITFQSGNCYSLVFDGSAVSLTKETPITLNNINARVW